MTAKAGCHSCLLLKESQGELAVFRTADKGTPLFVGEDEDGAVAVVLGVADSNGILQERYFHTLATVVATAATLVPRRAGELVIILPSAHRPCG